MEKIEKLAQSVALKCERQGQLYTGWGICEDWKEYRQMKYSIRRQGYSISSILAHPSHQDATDNCLIGLRIFPWENETLKSLALEMKLLGGTNTAWRGTIASLGTKVWSFFSLRAKWSYLHFAVGTTMSICRILKRKLKTLAEKIVVVTVTHSTYPEKYQSNCFNLGKKRM